MEEKSKPGDYFFSSGCSSEEMTPKLYKIILPKIVQSHSVNLR